MPIEQRFLSRAIARQKHAVSGTVVERDGKHAVEVLQAVLAPFAIRLQYDFRVAGASEAVAALFQLAAQILVIVNLPIEDDLILIAVVRHGLAPVRREVNNREARLRQTDAAIRRHPETTIVRPAVPERIAHTLEQAGIYGCSTGDGANDATHKTLIPRAQVLTPPQLEHHQGKKPMLIVIPMCLAGQKRLNRLPAKNLRVRPVEDLLPLLVPPRL